MIGEVDTMILEVVADRESLLILGDCFNVLPLINVHSIDLILCDLPYGSTACKWDTKIPLSLLWSQYSRILKPTAQTILTATQPFTSILLMSNIRKFRHEWIWHKSKSGSAFTAKTRPLAKHESILVFGSSGGTYNPQMREGVPYTRIRPAGNKINNHDIGLGRGESITKNTGLFYPDSVLKIQQKWRRQDQVHPTQKPVELMEYLIKTYTNPLDVVLDNAMGSGTTGIACRNTGRRFIGIEKDDGYFNIACKRIIS